MPPIPCSLCALVELDQDGVDLAELSGQYALTLGGNSTFRQLCQADGCPSNPGKRARQVLRTISFPGRPGQLPQHGRRCPPHGTQRVFVCRSAGCARAYERAGLDREELMMTVATIMRAGETPDDPGARYQQAEHRKRLRHIVKHRGRPQTALEAAVEMRATVDLEARMLALRPLQPPAVPGQLPRPRRQPDAAPPVVVLLASSRSALLEPARPALSVDLLRAPGRPLGADPFGPCTLEVCSDLARRLNHVRAGGRLRGVASITEAAAVTPDALTLLTRLWAQQGPTSRRALADPAVALELALSILT